MTKKMIVVGPILQWRAAKKQLPEVDGVAFVDFAELTAERLASEAPDVVISALVDKTFDALDLARLLSDFGFQGCYRAVVEALPSPALILAEVAVIAPDLDFDVFQIVPGPEA